MPFWCQSSPQFVFISDDLAMITDMGVLVLEAFLHEFSADDQIRYVIQNKSLVGLFVRTVPYQDNLVCGQLAGVSGIVTFFEKYWP